MKRIILYAVAVAAALLVPERGTDVGKLRPVELVYVYKEENLIHIETDTGDAGAGDTVAAAVNNLQDTTPDVIFLDTAKQLLVTEDTQELLGELAMYMKKGTHVCLAQLGIDPEEAAQYLGVHSPETAIGALDMDSRLPRLELDETTQKIILKICN